MKNKVAIVTGASSGIGRATARLFAENGATVVGVGRNEKELYAVRDELKDAAGSIRPHLGDVLEISQLDRIVSETVDSFGQIDILVNAAGILKGGSIEDTSLSDWDKQMNLNVRSVFYLMQKCIPHLEATKGSIVNVSSVTGTRAFPGVLAYCVSKAAVDQLTRCAALDLAPKGIRVNAVNPGVVVTNLHKRGGMDEEAYEKFLERTKETHPLGRAGKAEEIAELIRFLASDKAGWITGATYAIDGGRAETCAR
ncbi:MAG: SDR family oxidoreductase [Acidobacteria bacterium ACB1]|nr:NAD-dependent glycerol dehydrogenase [Pyrinomonadaceae bacterium]MCE7961916.1 SDR family oxidoreductase [Acidobacteria bacterium ACB1]RIJ91241.1 MAG: 3-oxoacyl-ACP reductase [Acidobacteriota bacterium]